MTSLHAVQFGKLILREKSIAQEYGRYEATLNRPLMARPAGGWVTMSLPSETSYGHFPYPESKADDLETVYPGERYQLHKKAAESFLRMAEAAAKDGVDIGLASAFRNRLRQEQLFYGEARKRGITIEERAKVCAPPGHSEHATGYTVDLRDNTPGALLEEKFETTEAFAWMQENGKRFGWVLSFPRDNKQGVMYEPWHWRWEGDAESRKLFEKARRFNAAAPSLEERELAMRQGDAYVKTMRTMRNVNTHAIEQLEKAGFDVVISGEGQWLKDDPKAYYYDHYEPALTVALVRRQNRELIATHRESIRQLKKETVGPYRLLSTMLAYAWSVVGKPAGGDGFVRVSRQGKPGK